MKIFTILATGLIFCGTLVSVRADEHDSRKAFYTLISKPENIDPKDELKNKQKLTNAIQGFKQTINTPFQDENVYGQQTPLTYAISKVSWPFEREQDEYDYVKAAIKILLDSGADPDSEDDAGHTPLTQAISSVRSQVIGEEYHVPRLLNAMQMLIDHGATVDKGAQIKDQEAYFKGDSPLTYATRWILVKSGRGQSPVDKAQIGYLKDAVKFLIQNEASPQVKRGPDKKTAFELANEIEDETVKKDVIRLLKKEEPEKESLLVSVLKKLKEKLNSLAKRLIG